MSEIRVSEIFGPTIQGEGALIGRPSVFVRTGGCDFRCGWCDTLYAVLPEYRHGWIAMTPEEILARVNALVGGRPILVTLSGGNPAIQPLAPLIAAGHAVGHSFAMETQGSLAPAWLEELDWLVLSPKPPSSDMAADWPALAACIDAAGGRPKTMLKVVVFDDADYAYAREAAARHPALPIYLQIGNDQPAKPNSPGAAGPDTEALHARFRWLVDRVTQDRWFEATVLPQLHVLVWGNRRGV